MNHRLRAALAALLLLLAAASGHASEVARADLSIVGVSLEVDTARVNTAVDVPAYVQTIFGGKKNDQAAHVDGVSVLGDLTGPGLDTPITLFTAPGQQFVLPALHEAGEYTLQNIRLVDAQGKFLQQAIPSFATIEVSAVFNTSVSVVQLSPDDLRARGITIDSRNYDVFQYSFTFTINGQDVTIPYTVVVDKRTHESIPQPAPNPYPLPPVVPNTPPPPRFQPPSTYTVMLDNDTDAVDVQVPPQFDIEKPIAEKPRIPAAIVIPTGFGVLHQFFAVILQVNNGAPTGSSIQLDGIRATLDAPLTLRVAKTTPSVSIGQAVPVYDAKTGATFLIATAKGSAEWSLEALKTGTHTVNIDVRATYKNPGQPDVPLHGAVSASLVVSDPRFHITFSHPDTIRKGEPYTAYAFVSNLSAQSQTVHLDTTDIPPCGQGYSSGVCRTEGTGITDLTLAPGEMSPVPYKLTPNIDGHIFASAGDASDTSSSVSVKLTMGVSASGIPLSPATLIMPYYARYLDPALVDAQLGILGLGYSLATAPLTAESAKFPRVIKSDVYQRAQDITRAGQRVFVAPTDARDALDNLALDLLDNVERPSLLASTTELAEWDQLRRQESDARSASAALARQLEATGLANSASMKDFAMAFAAATSHRSPFLFALVHGSSVSGAARPYALSLTGATTKSALDVPSEAASGWIRSLPYGELTKITSSAEVGELALVGRWKEDVQVSIVPQSDHFSVDLVYPDAGADATSGLLAASFDVTGAHAGTPVTFTIARGNQTIIVSGGSANAVATHLALTPLAVVAAAQDLHLDSAGHLVSILFNRPVRVADAANLRDLFTLTTRLDTKSYVSTRRNTTAVKYIPGAAVQDDGTILNVNFDKSLTKNSLVAYTLAFDPINGEAGGSTGATSLVPRIDNAASAGILFGHLLQADNTVVPQTAVELYSTNAQFDTTNDNGQFLFESVPKDIDNGINGNYLLSATAGGKYTDLHGSIRLLNTVEEVNLIFLGRGSAQGQLRYSDGTPIVGQTVVVSSTIFGEFRSGVTVANGRYTITDVPVGPLTFIGRDKDGRFVYATNVIRSAGEVVSQDLVIQLQDPPGAGSVHVTVRRSDILDPKASLVPNAHVGVYARGFGLKDGYTDANGELDFSGVPAGFITVLASEFNITRNSASIDVDLKADTVLDAALTLSVPSATDQAASVNVQGTVTKDDPASPNDTTKDTIVPGAVLQISGLASVIADAQGNFVYPNVPVSYGNGAKSMSVYDPATQRRGTFPLPTLIAGQTNTFSPRLKSSQPAGYASMKVRLFGARGEAVSGYRVISPYYPPITFQESTTPGVYELKNVAVPVTYDVYAVPSDRTGPYGDQWARGSVSVSFDGQTGVADLHLPGQGTVVAGFKINGQNCDTGACASGPVNVSYLAWDEVEQGITGQTHRVDPDPQTGHVTILKVPALSDVTVATIDNPAGYAQATTRLTFDGDSKPVTLTLSSLGDVSGRVLMPDVQSVVANAAVRLDGSVASYAAQQTKADGTFTFPAIAANQPFRITAEVTQNGIYRTGYVDARTPTTGGPVSNLTLVLREQSNVKGQVVDSTGAGVPLAKYWLRELAWPNRDFGTATNPLTADKYGNFIVNNVFTGAFRITAVSPDQQEIRGDYQGTIAFEADNRQTNVRVIVGSGGTGTITATVIDQLNNFAKVPNADVTLVRNGVDFDIASTDANGLATFGQVPVDGSYLLRAFSKAIGNTGSTLAFQIVADQTNPQTVLLKFRGTVSGVVHDPEAIPAEAPVVGAPVSLRELGFGTRASTDGNGAFTFLGVPEGTFTVDAIDPDTGRTTQSETNFINGDFPERTTIVLELARTAQLDVKAYLPDDAGHPSTLAPLVAITVNQSSDPPFVYTRALQGNDLTFVKMDPSKGYLVTAQEIGGEGRTVSTKGSFGGALTGNVSLTFPTSGTVNVKVQDAAGHPVSNALVTINGGAKTATVYTDATGSVSLSGFPLGPITVQATNTVVSASASGSLGSHSIPLSFILNLGASTSVTGHVDAEATNGAPSVGTRVLLSATSRLLTSALSLETRTDATGAFHFDAIPVGGTTVTVRALGPDDVTVGAIVTQAIADGTTQPVDLGHLKLDATPPRVLSIDPANNANNVSPNSVVTVVFSEMIAPQYLTTQYFQLYSTDDGVKVSNAVISAASATDGTYTVTITAPDPTAAQIAAGQKFRLKSNVTYTLAVAQGIQDLTGNVMAVTVGASFTTVDYTEPSIISINPAVELPMPLQTTFRIKFNKAIDDTSFTPANGGLLKLEQLDSYKGTATRIVALAAPYHDPADPSTLVVPLGEAIVQSAYYRLTINGTRDTQSPPNVQTTARVFDFFSVDNTPPVLSLGSPVPDGHNLIAGVTYTFTPTIVDQGTTNASTDIAYVDWLDQNGTPIFHAKTAPFSYTRIAPTTAPATLTLQASATDFSGHTSAIVSRSWSVDPNLPPKNLALTLTPANGYPGQSATIKADASFDDEGVSATVNFQLDATNADGSPYSAPVGSMPVTRSSVAAPWPHAIVTFAIPSTLKPGSATVKATVIDGSTQSSSTTATLTVNADNNPPVTVSFLPNPETHYQSGQTLTVQLQTKDAESGIAKAVITIGTNTPETINATGTGASSFNATTGVWTFTKSIIVPARNADTRTHITAVAYDVVGLSTTAAADVIYDKVNDPSIPQAWWVTPLDGAAIPLDQTNWKTTLRVKAVGNIVSVTFSGSALAAPVVLNSPKSGTTDTYETQQILTLPPEGSSTTITASISDGIVSHLVELPITLDPVKPDTVVPDILTITPSLAPSYAGKSILVRGAGTTLKINASVSLKNLMALDGALVTTADLTKIDLTATDHLFVDADSSINAVAKGDSGAWATRDDNSKNLSQYGVTGGSGPGAVGSGSYAGIGGSNVTSPTNATYGSLTNPIDFGAGGGSASTVCCNDVGANGGGVIALHGGTATTDLSRIVIAGLMRADGGTGIGQGGAGAGGSITINSQAFITGPSTVISANGGDDDGQDKEARGGGGGRIAVTIGQRFDYVDTSLLLQARGGRNGASTEGATFTDGGAGTILLTRAGETNGELTVSSYDTRYPSSTHVTHGTPISSPLTFDAVTVGPRALARFDGAYTIAGSASAKIDPTALLLGPTDIPSVTVTSPVDGSNFIQYTNLTANFDAAATDGIETARMSVTGIPNDTYGTYGDHPTNATGKQLTVLVPSDYVPGDATMTLHVVSRSGRTADAAAKTYHVVANAAPLITQFDVAPAGGVYPGKTATVTATASDDVAVTSLLLSSTAGTVTNGTPVTDPVAHTMSETFTVLVPLTATPGVDIGLTLNASDGFPNRVPTPGSNSIKVLKDSIPPVVQISQPVAGTLFDVSTQSVIHVLVTATDAETAIKQITASIEGGTTITLTATGTANQFAGDLPLPGVPGGSTVTRALTVTATDYGSNSTPATVSVQIKPDPAAPIVTWSCGNGGMFVAGGTATLSVTALPGATGNAVSTVTFSDGTTTIPTTKNGNLYTGTYTVPLSAADGSTITLSATATSVSGSAGISPPGSFTVVVSDTTPIDPGTSGSFTIDSTNAATYDNHTVVIKSGTVTIKNAHTFDRLLVLGGKVVHPATVSTTVSPLNVTITRQMYVACAATIDASGLGYGRNTTYSGANPIAGAGSHLGIGNGSATNTSYGSVVQPQESGAGGADCCNFYPGGLGGGVVMITGTAATIVNDGAIKASGGAGNVNSGAGGSIWINANSVSGTGTLDASGGTATGGGGAIALQYNSGTPWTMTAYGGAANAAGAGTVYVKGPNTTYGTLTIDNNGVSGQPTVLPSLGSGSAQTGSIAATLVTGSSVNILPFFSGSWVEITTSAGDLKGTWRIAPFTAATKTLTLVPNGNETISLQPGDKWQGVYLMDNVIVRNGGKLSSADPIRMPSLTVQGPADLLNPVTAASVTVSSGRVSAVQITATNLTINSGATLTQGATDALRLNVSGTGTLTVQGTIDVTGSGYGRNTTYTGAKPNAGAGSHLGIGYGSATNASYGSVVQPQESGAGGADCCNFYPGGVGGGVVLISAPTGTVVNNGVIKAAGAAGNVYSGAGGSIWINANSVSGSGTVDASGGTATGGGGAIALQYSSGTPWTMTAYGGATSGGGAGTVYVKGPNATYGTLTVENRGVSGQPTVLPSLGSGTAQAGTSGPALVTDASSNILTFFAGHWVEITDSNGVLKGTWRIHSPQPAGTKTITLDSNNGETINLVAGDKWQGVYRFDAVRTVTGAKLQSGDPIRLNTGGAVTLDGGTGGTLDLSGTTLTLTGDDVTESGTVALGSVTMNSLTVNGTMTLSSVTTNSLVVTGVLNVNSSVSTTGLTVNGVLSAGTITAADITVAGTLNTNTVTASTAWLKSGGKIATLSTGAQALSLSLDTMTVDSGGSVDATARGYASQATYDSSLTAPGTNDGGSHMGVGGVVHTAGTTFGSVEQPQESGGGGWLTAGGGNILINAGTFTLNGTVKARGANLVGSGDGGGGGGSVWIKANTVSGTGSVDASGGNGYSGGGGGAISVIYTSGSAPAWPMTAYGGTRTGGQTGGAGTIYTFGPSSTYGDLTVENNNIGVTQPTKLPSLGGGTAQAGTSGPTLVTDAAANILKFFAGHWIEVRDSSGTTLKGTWRIHTPQPTGTKTVTLDPNTVGETINLLPGDKWQGVYRFDAVHTATGARITGADPIRLGANGILTLAGATTSGQLDLSSYDLNVPNEDVTVTGNIAVPSITAANLTIKSGAVVNGPTSLGAASLKLMTGTDGTTGTLTIESGASVDASSRGYASQATYDSSLTAPGSNDGGSHMGVGGVVHTAGTTFGSVEQPQESGGGGWLTVGGGNIAVNAGTFVLNGTVKARGANLVGSGDGGGGGGSVWIRANTVSGTGSVDASGGNGYSGGGGGAISVTYKSGSAPTWPMTAYGGTRTGGAAGGAGTIYAFAPNATYGTLTVDNNNTSGQSTVLPSLGAGFAQAGSGGAVLVTDRSALTPAQKYYSGHWVEVSTSAGVLKGTWRIAPFTTSSNTLTLLPNGAETISIQQGDYWRGVYRFDGLSVLRAARLSSNDVVYVNGNTPPVVDTTKISVNSTGPADFVVGTVGALTDSDQPVKVAITSSAGLVYNGTANSDGSFNVQVGGPLGETFTLVATDSNASFAVPSVPMHVPGQITNANTVAALTAQPVTVSAGSPLSLNVRLLYPAHTGGTPVSFVSSDPASISVPASIVIPVGNTTASIAVTAGSPAQTTQVTLSASASGTPQSVVVTIVPATTGLSAITLTNNAPTGDTSLTGTATLGAAAPAGGAVVTLSSSNSGVAVVPASVVVPAGAVSATFNVDAHQPGSATITGTYGATQSATLTVTSCASLLSVAPPASSPLTTVWFDDSVPAGATLTGGSLVTSQAASGSTSISLSGSGPQSFALTGMPALTPAATDTLVFYALVNPCNPPRQILAIWNDGTADHRASWGENVVDTTIDATAVGSIDLSGQWIRLQVQAAAIGASAKTLRSFTVKTYGGEAWFDLFGSTTCALQANTAAPTSFSASDQIWFDDALPAGAVPQPSDGATTFNWTWDTSQSASGSASHTDGIHSNFHQHYFTLATATLRAVPGASIVTYVLIDPCNPPRELFLQWYDGSSWEHRAYWGEDLEGFGTDGTTSRYRMGALPVAGKWVRLEIPVALVGLDNLTISGAAFGAWDGRVWFDRVGMVTRVNLAQGKTATQSSTFAPQAAASDAVDGNTDGNYNNNSVATTNTAAQPWWQVDLGSSQPIEDVQLWNRTDCCPERLTDFWVLVSDQPMPTGLSAARAQAGVTSYHFPNQSGNTTDVRIRRTGRYVRVQLTGTNYLSLAEVQVWAPATASPTNYAGGAHASESTQYLSYYPEDAVNGDLNSAYNGVGAISHTTTETDPHWDVDLGASNPLSTVDVMLRADCTALNCTTDQWPNFYVFVSDQPFSSNTVAGTIAQAGVGVWYHGTARVPTVSIPVNRTGRYVRIARSGSAIVTLNEVQVWSQSNDLKALVKPPEQTDH